MYLQIHSGEEPKPVGSIAEQVSRTVWMRVCILGEGREKWRERGGREEGKGKEECTIVQQ